MKRLSLKTNKGFIFMSPFVYPDKIAEQKLEAFQWLVKKEAVLSLVFVLSYPPETLWTKKDEDIYGQVFFNKVKKLEALWEKEKAKWI